MRTKITIMIMLSMLLVLSIATTSAFAQETKATVKFEEGDPEFGNPEADGDLNNMDIYFGEHTLPIGSQLYKAEDSDHTLRIADARRDGNAGKWEVQVEMSDFSSVAAANSFAGTVTLESPTYDTGLTVADSLSIISGADALTVVVAGAGLAKGNYDITWPMDEIALSFDAVAAASITKPAEYEATMTWTLGLLP